ncbi:hypothetical protein OXX59_002647 [Metschnikowia pulcherrima]
MSADSEITLIDSRLLVQVAHAIVSYPEDVSRVITPLLSISKNPKVIFTTSQNLLRLLLIHTSPIAVSSAEVARLSSALVHAEPDPELSESDLIEDLENLSIWLSKEFQIVSADPEEALVQTARDLSVSLATKANSLSFNIDHSADPKALLFAFAEAKCLQLGSFFDNVTELAESFDDLAKYGPFEAWYHGLILPYNYYYQNYASLGDSAAPQQQYLALKDYEKQFSYLIRPLKSYNESLVSKLSPRAYFSHVILPLASYNQNNLGPISVWMFEQHSGCTNITEFQLWDELLRTILSFHNHRGNKFTKTDYEGLIRHFIFACLYFGLYKSEKSSSFAQANIQIQIRDTLQYLVEMIGEPDFQPTFDLGTLEFPEYESLVHFATEPPSHVKQITDMSLEKSINIVLQIYSTCCALHSMNDLTVKKYFELKSQSTSHPHWFHKEVMKIFSRAGPQNFDQTLSALSVFSDSFLSQSSETVSQLDQLVFDNLLQHEHFDQAVSYLNELTSERKMSTQTAYEAVSRKFWDLFENASNLDDRIGKLKLATNCLDLLDTISKESTLTKEHRMSVVKIKHLLKALHSLKNFKLVLVRNQPVTPKQILDRVTSAGSEEKYPQFTIISSVLEQNPKSYLAHERLYKIVNDLAIYADLDLSVVSFPRIQSACVESALIDGNFDFAYKQTKALITYYVDTQNTETFNDVWLMFYQVGKYISSDWFGEYDAEVQEEKIRVLIRQREILSLAIKHSKPNAFTTDNSRLLIGQFRHVNSEIKKWHEEAELHRSEEVQDAVQSTQQQIQENITGILNEASHSQKQASEKISNLFVSGLGWAIGAKR